MHFFNENLAFRIGKNESIFLQNLYYICKKKIVCDNGSNENIWIKMSYTKIQEFQPYFTRSEIRTLLKNLLENGLLVKSQTDKRVSNTMSYSLTYRCWVLMLSQEKKYELKKLEKDLAKCNEGVLSFLLKTMLNDANVLAKSNNPWSILTEDCKELANIIIEYRTFIEKDRNIEKTGDKNISDEKTFVNYFDPYIENKIIEIISENSTFKRKVEKTFNNYENFCNKVVFPAIEKHGSSEVLEALKKSVEGFLGHNSPVATFFMNLNVLELQN